MRFVRGLGATLSDIMPHAKEERNCPNMNDDATHPAHAYVSIPSSSSLLLSNLELSDTRVHEP